MSDLTKDGERLLQEGKMLVRDNQEGGRHRRATSIGQGSAKIRRRNWMKRAKYFAGAILTIFVTASVAGLVLEGIGFTGVMMAALAVMAAAFVFSNYPKVKTPKRADLTKGDVRQMVGKTELWLEHQRAALPPPAAKIVEDMGVQLDSLGLQLETIDQEHPAAREVRKLVGEVLPETVDSYRNIPAHLRNEKRAGATPDQQVTESLSKISKEIDHVTRQLAEGSLDDLAIKTRYLEYKYGEGDDTGINNDREPS